MISLICGISETKQMNIGGKKERKTKKQTLNYENKLMVIRGEMGGAGSSLKQVMGIKECTCPDAHWVLYGIDESLNSTPGTNITL